MEEEEGPCGWVLNLTFSPFLLNILLASWSVTNLSPSLPGTPLLLGTYCHYLLSASMDFFTL